MIETTDQYRPANLANSAVLRMLEEEEAERRQHEYFRRYHTAGSSERRSRSRFRRTPHSAVQFPDKLSSSSSSATTDKVTRPICIDRETVLKINRRPPQRHRDVSWPPLPSCTSSLPNRTIRNSSISPETSSSSYLPNQKHQQQVQSTCEDCSRRSRSAEIHFDDRICKRHEIFHLKEMFDKGIIFERNNIKKGSLYDKTMLSSSAQNAHNTTSTSCTGVDHHHCLCKCYNNSKCEKEISSEFYDDSNEVLSRKEKFLERHEWPPRSYYKSNNEQIVSRTFHLKDDEVHFGLIEPIKEYFERVADYNLKNSRRCKSCSGRINTAVKPSVSSSFSHDSQISENSSENVVDNKISHERISSKGKEEAVNLEDMNGKSKQSHPEETRKNHGNSSAMSSAGCRLKSTKRWKSYDALNIENVPKTDKLVKEQILSTTEENEKDFPLSKYTTEPNNIALISSISNISLTENATKKSISSFAESKVEHSGKGSKNVPVLPEPLLSSSLSCESSASQIEYKSNSYITELPPPKPRGNSNKNVHSSKRKLNLNNLGNVPAKEDDTVRSAVSLETVKDSSENAITITDVTSYSDTDTHQRMLDENLKLLENISDFAKISNTQRDEDTKQNGTTTLKESDFDNATYVFKIPFKWQQKKKKQIRQFQPKPRYNSNLQQQQQQIQFQKNENTLPVEKDSSMHNAKNKSFQLRNYYYDNANFVQPPPQNKSDEQLQENNTKKSTEDSNDRENKSDIIPDKNKSTKTATLKTDETFLPSNNNEEDISSFPHRRNGNYSESKNNNSNKNANLVYENYPSTVLFKETKNNNKVSNSSASNSAENENSKGNNNKFSLPYLYNKIHKCGTEIKNKIMSSQKSNQNFAPTHSEVGNTGNTCSKNSEINKTIKKNIKSHECQRIHTKNINDDRNFMMTTTKSEDISAVKSATSLLTATRPKHTYRNNVNIKLTPVTAYKDNNYCRTATTINDNDNIICYNLTENCDKQFQLSQKEQQSVGIIKERSKSYDSIKDNGNNSEGSRIENSLQLNKITPENYDNDDKKTSVNRSNSSKDAIKGGSININNENSSNGNEEAIRKLNVKCCCKEGNKNYRNMAKEKNYYSQNSSKLHDGAHMYHLKDSKYVVGNSSENLTPIKYHVTCANNSEKNGDIPVIKRHDENLQHSLSKQENISTAGEDSLTASIIRSARESMNFPNTIAVTPYLLTPTDSVLNTENQVILRKGQTREGLTFRGEGEKQRQNRNHLKDYKDNEERKSNDNSRKNDDDNRSSNNNNGKKENTKKYCQKEISKSDLSLSFSTTKANTSTNAIDKRRYYRRGMYFTDGEYIWEPLDLDGTIQYFSLPLEQTLEEKYNKYIQEWNRSILYNNNILQNLLEEKSAKSTQNTVQTDIQNIPEQEEQYVHPVIENLNVFSRMETQKTPANNIISNRYSYSNKNVTENPDYVSDFPNTDNSKTGQTMSHIEILPIPLGKQSHTRKDTLRNIGKAQIGIPEVNEGNFSSIEECMRKTEKMLYEAEKHLRLAEISALSSNVMTGCDEDTIVLAADSPLQPFITYRGVQTGKRPFNFPMDRTIMVANEIVNQNHPSVTSLSSEGTGQALMSSLSPPMPPARHHSHHPRYYPEHQINYFTPMVTVDQVENMPTAKQASLLDLCNDARISETFDTLNNLTAETIAHGLNAMTTTACLTGNDIIVPNMKTTETARITEIRKDDDDDVDDVADNGDDDGRKLNMKSSNKRDDQYNVNVVVLVSDAADDEGDFFRDKSLSTTGATNSTRNTSSSSCDVTSPSTSLYEHEQTPINDTEGKILEALHTVKSSCRPFAVDKIIQSRNIQSGYVITANAYEPRNSLKSNEFLIHLTPTNAAEENNNNVKLLHN